MEQARRKPYQPPSRTTNRSLRNWKSWWRLRNSYSPVISTRPTSPFTQAMINLSVKKDNDRLCHLLRREERQSLKRSSTTMMLCPITESSNREAAMFVDRTIWTSGHTRRWVDTNRMTRPSAAATGCMAIQVKLWRLPRILINPTSAFKTHRESIYSNSVKGWPKALWVCFPSRIWNQIHQRNGAKCRRG